MSGAGYGAIGGAASAVLSPLALDAIDPTHAPLDQGQLAVLAAGATFAGGGLAGLAGQNAMAGATVAQNEALNNSSAGDHWAKPGQQNEGEKFVVKPTPQGAPVDQAQQGGGGSTDAEAVTVGSSSTVAGAAVGATSNVKSGFQATASRPTQMSLRLIPDHRELARLLRRDLLSKGSRALIAAQ